jgi:hypothetical protein
MNIPYTRFAAVGALFLTLFAAGCQNENPTQGADKNGVLSTKTNGKSGAGSFLFEAATCKDKNPAELGIAFKCTNDTDLVCGCDGKTYVNACNAWGVGQVNVDHKGACTGAVKDDPAVDPIDPIDPVHPISPVDTPRFCGTPDGVDPVLDHAPGPNQHPLLYDAYASCREPVPDVAVKCTDEKHPVCGCDNVTYLNSCVALGAGQVNVAYEGECKPIK